VRREDEGAGTIAVSVLMAMAGLRFWVESASWLKTARRKESDFILNWNINFCVMKKFF
jgi:hypothetical protein